MGIWAFAQKSGQDIAVRGRLALSALWTPSRDAPLRVRSGFINDGGGVVTVSTGTMNISVTPFKAMIQTGTTQGAYPVVLDATGTVTLPSGGASDAAYTISALVEDSLYDLSGVQQARLIAYTTAGGPPPGTVLPIRAMNLRAGVSAGTGGLQPTDLGADLRIYTVATGGILPVLSTAKPPAPGMANAIFETDTGILRLWDGANWDAVRTANLFTQEVFSASGQWEKLPDLTGVRLRAQAPGGGGGACGTSGVGTASAGGGGGGGEYVEAFIPAALLPATVAVTIGAAGAGGVAGSGAVAGDGGTVSFGAILTALGGSGAAYAGAAANTFFAGGTGGTGGGGTAPNQLRIPGQTGGVGRATNGEPIPSVGGNSQLGYGGEQAQATNGAGGRPGRGYGGGGSGALLRSSQTTLGGGPGSGGAIVVENIF